MCIQRVCVRKRSGLPAYFQIVAGNRVPQRVAFEHRLRQAEVGRVRPLVINSRLDGEGVAVVRLEDELRLHVFDVEIEVAPAVALLVEIVQKPPGGLIFVASAEGAVPDKDAVLSAFEVEAAVEFQRRIRGNEVDNAPDCLRTVHDLAAPLEHFDALHAVDRGRIIHFGLAVGRQRNRQTVFEHEHLAAAVGVEAPHAHVEAHGHGTRILAKRHARNFLEHLVGIDRLRFVKLPLRHEEDRAGYFREDFVGAAHDFNVRRDTAYIFELEVDFQCLRWGNLYLQRDRLEILRKRGERILSGRDLG